MNMYVVSAWLPGTPSPNKPPPALVLSAVVDRDPIACGPASQVQLIVRSTCWHENLPRDQKNQTKQKNTQQKIHCLWHLAATTIPPTGLFLEDPGGSPSWAFYQPLEKK